MRDIKFRAFVKAKKIMREVIGFNYINKEFYLRYEEDKNIMANTEEVEIMQYTGLKDKNGKEIYEGDIVKHHKHNTVTNCIYNDKYVTFAFKNAVEEYFYIDIDSKDLEIIGNIYENPELLEGNQYES